MKSVPLSLAVAVTTLPAAPAAAAERPPTFTHPTRITNPYLPLSSLARVELRGREGRTAVRSVRTRLRRTERFRVHGRTVRAVVVRDASYHDGRLHEVAWDFYAQADDGTVHYLGEDVDIYDRRGRRVVSHEGAFRYGRDTRTLGVAMPARPRPGQRFTFEAIPGTGSERARVVRADARLTVPHGRYCRAVELAFVSRPDGGRERKFYARGVGLVAERGEDGGVELVSVRRG